MSGTCQQGKTTSCCRITDRFLSVGFKSTLFLGGRFYPVGFVLFFCSEPDGYKMRLKFTIKIITKILWVLKKKSYMNWITKNELLWKINLGLLETDDYLKIFMSCYESLCMCAMYLSICAIFSLFFWLITRLSASNSNLEQQIMISVRKLQEFRASNSNRWGLNFEMGA